MKTVLLLLLVPLCLSSAKDFEKLKDYSSNYNFFIADVYKELLKSNSVNFLACPSSVNIVLSLLTTAAKGSTLQQLSAALRLPTKFQDIHDIFAPLTPELQQNDKYYKLISANKIYVSNDLQISDQFRTVASKVYDVDIENLNLNDTKESAKEINQWVEEKTYHIIKRIIDPTDLINSTHTVLASTALFAGRWRFPFTPSLTKRSCFYVSRKMCIETDIMEQTYLPVNGVNYYESPEFDARLLEIPYSSTEVSMLIVLPNRVEGLAALEARIGDILLLPVYKFNSEYLIEVTLPKFKIETNIEMKQVVEALGVKKAFEAGANFRGLGYYKNNTLIDKIIQRVSIEVDEIGTFAIAAGLQGGGGYGGYLPEPPPIKQFFVDRPFLFCVRLSRSEEELAYNIFVGRYVSPQQ